MKKNPMPDRRAVDDHISTMTKQKEINSKSEPSPFVHVQDLLKRCKKKALGRGSLPKPLVACLNVRDHGGKLTGEVLVAFVVERRLCLHLLPTGALVDGDSTALKQFLALPGLLALDIKPSLLKRALRDNVHGDCFVLNDGPNRLESGSNSIVLYAYGGKTHHVVGQWPRGQRAVVWNRSARQNKAGTHQGWDEGLAPLLEGNPLALLPCLATLATPVTQILNLSQVLLHVHGPSSRGKTTTAIVAASMHTSDVQVQDCIGTARGTGEFAAAHSVKTTIIDETHLATGSFLGELVYATGNKNDRLVSVRAAHQDLKTAIRGNVIALGERPAWELLLPSQRNLGGIAARLIDVAANHTFGMFAAVPEGMNEKSLAEYINSVALANGGHLFSAWLAALAANHTNLSRWWTKRKPVLVDKLLDGFDLDDPIELRRADAIVTWIFAGQLASKLCVWSVSQEACLKAGREALRQSLNTNPAARADKEIIESVREYLENGRSKLIPFIDYHRHTGVAIGYTKETSKSGRLILLPNDQMEKVSCKYGLNAVCETLNQAGFLVANDGRKYQIRVPSSGESGSYRRSFYAIHSEILTG